MVKKNLWQQLPIILSLLVSLLALPALLLAVKTNLDNRSRAIIREEKKFTNPFPYLKFPFVSPTPSPSPTPRP